MPKVKWMVAMAHRRTEVFKIQLVVGIDAAGELLGSWDNSLEVI